MTLPCELLDAIAVALEREATEHDVGQRAQLLTVARATLEAWKRGRLTTHEAAVLLRTMTQGN
jgi:DNA-binding transcriptional regulator YiaG